LEFANCIRTHLLYPEGKREAETLVIMDPLGARPQMVDISEVSRWGTVQPDGPVPSPPADKEPAHVVSPFAVREDLNNKVALW